MLDLAARPVSYDPNAPSEPRRWLTETETAGERRALQWEQHSGISILPPHHLIRVAARGGAVALFLVWEGEAPPWLRPVLEVLAELLALPENWNSYGAQRISQAAVRAAVLLLRDVMSDTAPVPQVVPTSPGGVQLEWHTGGIDLEVSIHPSGDAFVLFEDLRTGEEWEGRLPEKRADLAAALVELAQRA